MEVNDDCLGQEYEAMRDRDAAHGIWHVYEGVCLVLSTFEKYCFCCCDQFFWGFEIIPSGLCFANIYVFARGQKTRPFQEEQF